MSLYKTELNKDIFITTVEIVREKLRSHIFLPRNEASIFDAKIQVNLFSAKHARWAPSCEMKSVTLLKRNG